jgi:Leucine-rich repeat (LRR) protein
MREYGAMEVQEAFNHAWNLVQLGRYSIRGQNFVQQEGSPVEKILLEADAWRKFLSKADLDGYKELQIIGKRITELPPEIALFTCLETLRASGHSITHVPDAVTKMSTLKFVDLSCNQLTEAPTFLPHVNVDLRGNPIPQL